jgi:FAD dependent oxidoreductase
VLHLASWGVCTALGASRDCGRREDILTARKPENGMARGTYPDDIHTPSGKGTVLRSVPARDAYDVRLRCLLPLGTDDLLTAGRCISVTHVAHSWYRVTQGAHRGAKDRENLHRDGVSDGALVTSQ